MKRKILEYAVRILDVAVSPEALRMRYDEELGDAVIYVEGSDAWTTLSEVARTAWQRNWGSISASVSYRATAAPPSFTAYFVEVEVDTETGRVRPVRVVAGADIGTVINPELAEGQVQGGFVMGWGWAVLEDTPYNPETGALENMGFITDYKVPTAGDIPPIEDFRVIFASTYEPTGPFGAKGVGEPALIPTAPAVLNAIADALGERIYHLPANLERVQEAARRRSQKGGKG